jgi:hypothetical protein
VEVEERTVSSSVLARRQVHVPRCAGASRTVVALRRPLIRDRIQCYHVPGGVLSRDHILGNAAPVAVFTGRPLRTREDHRPHPLPTLKIFPGAHTGMLLDHIVLTALLIERWRLAPEL